MCVCVYIYIYIYIYICMRVYSLAGGNDSVAVGKGEGVVTV